MRSTGIIFRKELRDTLRDHRTLITMFLIPLLIIPIAINFMGRMGVAGADDDGFVRVVVVASDNGHDLEWKFRGDQRFFVQRATDAESAKAMVQSNDADVALVVPADFDVHLRSGRSGSIDVFSVIFKVRRFGVLFTIGLEPLRTMFLASVSNRSMLRRPSPQPFSTARPN
jgi:ABC-type Na+ efflux pump permease subunit